MRWAVAEFQGPNAGGKTMRADFRGIKQAALQKRDLYHTELVMLHKFYANCD